MADNTYLVKVNKCLIPSEEVTEGFIKTIAKFSGSVTLTNGTGSTQLDLVGGLNPDYGVIVSPTYVIGGGVLLYAGVITVHNIPKTVIHAYSPSGLDGVTVDFIGAIIDLSND